MNKRQYKSLYEEAILRLQGLIESGNYNPQIAVDFNEELYKKMITNKDAILCSNRYIWENLPSNLTSQQLESLFYRWGSLAFFIDKNGLLISRYTNVGKLNPYGRLNKIQPIDFAGHNYGTIKDVINNAGKNTDINENVAVIISDYTADYSNIEESSRYIINKGTTIKDQVAVYRQLNINIALSIKKALAICDTEEQRNTVLSQVATMLDPSTTIVPIAKNSKGKSTLEDTIEMFNFDNNFDTQNYCQQIDYYDKVRRSFNGVPAPDTFEKKERKLTSETEDTTTHTNLVLIDGYLQRYNGLQLLKKYYPDNEDIQGIEIYINDVLQQKTEVNEDDEQICDNDIL